MGIKIIADNRKAHFEYEIMEKYEAGLVLMGSEVKSLRAGLVNLKDSYIAFRGSEAYLQNAHISEYQASSYNNHHPERLRKLLLNKTELDKIRGRIQEKSFSCVPTKIYLKDGLIKLEIAVGKGKKVGDKRRTVANREAKRDLARAIKRDRE